MRFPTLLLVLVTLLGACGGDPVLRGFALTWRLTDAAAPDPTTAPSLTCAQAAVSTISLDLNDRATNESHHVSFDCTAMEAQTPAIAESNYQVLAIAHASDGSSRSQARFDADNFNDLDADLGVVIFTVNLH